MKITGTLTDYGVTLDAQCVTNGEKVEITRIAAGSGETPLSYEYLVDHEMYLTMSSEVKDGETVYYGLLNMASAEESFTLREIGLYVTKSIVRLYKIYRLSQPIDIDNTQNHTIRFTFREKDLTNAIFDGYVMPESVVTYDILTEHLGALVKYKDETVSYSCSANALDGVIGNIPKCVEKNYVINLTGATANTINLEGFYGGGSITINGYENNQTTPEGFTRVEGGVKITDCTAKIVLNKLKLVCSEYYDSSLDVYRSTSVRVSKCALGAAGESYVARVNGSGIFFEDCCISEIKGSAALVFSEGSQVKWGYRKAQMLNRDFMVSGTAFVRVNSNSVLTFIDELTESGIYSLTVTVNKGVLVTNTGSGTNARVRFY